MRCFAIALGVCLTFGLISSPLEAAVNSSHAIVRVKAKKSKPKIKAHKVPKRKAHPVVRH